jgi:hypothetical protein
MDVSGPVKTAKPACPSTERHFPNHPSLEHPNLLTDAQALQPSLAMPINPIHARVMHADILPDVLQVSNDQSMLQVSNDQSSFRPGSYFPKPQTMKL